MTGPAMVDIGVLRLSAELDVEQLAPGVPMSARCLRPRVRNQLKGS